MDSYSVVPATEKTLKEVRDYIAGLDGAPGTGLAKELTQLDNKSLLTDIKARLDSLKTYTDGIELLLTAINTDTTTENTNLAAVISALNDIKTYTDGLEGYTDGLETTASALNTLITTLNGYVDGIEGLLTTLSGKDYSTETTLTATKTVLDNILTKLNASIAVTGTFWQATQPISAASLPLPSGAATAAKQDDIKTELQKLNSLVPAVYDYISLSYTGTDLTGVVFKTGGAAGATVSTLTLAYSGGNLVSVTKT